MAPLPPIMGGSEKAFTNHRAIYGYAAGSFRTPHYWGAGGPVSLMKILLCPDSFKGSLSSPDAAKAMETGLRRVWPDADIVQLPLADGGEGTLHALLAAGGDKAEWRHETVCGPLGKPVEASWGWLPDTKTAVVELAQAAGLSLVPDGRRDPKITTTFGVGQLLLSALREPNVRRVVIGLGGSATNDGGAGLLCALGVRLLDEAGQNLPPGGAALAHLVRVDTSGLFERAAEGVRGNPDCLRCGKSSNRPQWRVGNFRAAKRRDT